MKITLDNNEYYIWGIDSELQKMAVSITFSLTISYSVMTTRHQH